MEILSYMRHAKEDDIYAERLARSMHLAWRAEDGSFQPFHHNEGILYAKAVSGQDGVLEARSLKSPWLFSRADGGYGVAAIRTLAEGRADPEAEGCILLFSSSDLVHYEELGLFRLQRQGAIEAVRCAYDVRKRRYIICWKNEDGEWLETESALEAEAACPGGRSVNEPSVGEAAFEKEELKNLEGACPCNSIQVPEEAGEYLLKKLTVPVCVGMELSGQGPFETEEELRAVKAVASYSDTTRVERKIDWERAEGGRVRGRVHQEHFPLPFAQERADPVCMYRNGKYYFIATNDADGNNSLYMRCSDTLEGIAEAEEALFLDTKTYEGIGGLLWAPEFHEIGGRLYVFHAATSGEFYCEESRVRRLREGGDPMRREDWSEPFLVLKKDGTPLCEEGKVISLDMTVFQYESETYAMWSQRQFLPVDQGAWLYLAKLDEKEPWKLISDPVCIAKPEYGWENNHTYVTEGPYALERDGQLMLTYAAGAIDTTYTVGLLRPVMGSDILNPDNWRKNNYPLMSSRSAEGEFGPGHNSYVTDENGLTWNFYHVHPGADAPRCSAARRTHFDIDGEPMLDVTEEFDLPEKFRNVEAAVGFTAETGV